MVLPSGEIEVLATSLMDEQKFQTGGFKELYFLRWGVETFFAKLKGRLSLENFTGKSVESVKQDFFSYLYWQPRKCYDRRCRRSVEYGLNR